MSSLSVKDLSTQIDKLMAEHTALRARSQTSDLSDLGHEQDSFAVRLHAAIERLAPGANTYTREMDAVTNDHRNSTGGRIRVYLGILSALRADANDGWLEGIAELLHADTFSDFLDQATELVDKGYKDAAAVVAGSTLEAHIRLLCDKYGISTQLVPGQPKKADLMNSELAKATAYNNLQQKAVTGWLAIRNSAAHGDYGKYSKNEVIDMTNSVRNFLIQHPA
jgi:hypothetical protein